MRGSANEKMPIAGPPHTSKNRLRPSAATVTHRQDLTWVVLHGFQERHELVAGLAGRRDGLAGRRGDLAGPRQVAGEEEAAAEGGGARRGAAQR